VTLTIHDCHVNEVGQTLSMLNLDVQVFKAKANSSKNEYDN
jgi:hypothetical protein